MLFISYKEFDLNDLDPFFQGKQGYPGLPGHPGQKVKFNIILLGY